jgi:hypothetical protein
MVSKIMNLSKGGRTPDNHGKLSILDNNGGRLSDDQIRQSIRRFSDLNSFAVGKNFSNWLDV